MADEIKEEKQSPKLSKYIGPEYRRAIIMPDGKKLNPKIWTAEETERYFTKYPQTKAWFK